MSLRLALAQFDFPVGAVHANADRLIEMIGVARDEYGADVVLFPELALSGYPPEDLLLRPSFLADCEAALSRIAQATTGIVAVVGWPQSVGSVVYNAASVLRDGAIEHTYRKRETQAHAESLLGCAVAGAGNRKGRTRRPFHGTACDAKFTSRGAPRSPRRGRRATSPW